MGDINNKQGKVTFEDIATSLGKKATKDKIQTAINSLQDGGYIYEQDGIFFIN